MSMCPEITPTQSNASLARPAGRSYFVLKLVACKNLHLDTHFTVSEPIPAATKEYATEQGRRRTFSQLVYL